MTELKAVKIVEHEYQKQGIDTGKHILTVIVEIGERAALEAVVSSPHKVVEHRQNDDLKYTFNTTHKAFRIFTSCFNVFQVIYTSLQLR